MFWKVFFLLHSKLDKLVMIIGFARDQSSEKLFFSVDTETDWG